MLKREPTRRQVVAILSSVFLAVAVLAGFEAIPRSARGLYIIGVVCLWFAVHFVLVATSIRRSKRR